MPCHADTEVGGNRVGMASFLFCIDKLEDMVKHDEVDFALA
jgi:hypothetical protein